MKNAKSLLQSKTFWVAMAQLALAGIVIFTGVFPESAYVGTALAIKSALDMYLRILTAQPIDTVV